MPLNALTIDVEEHFHAHAYEKCIDRATWDQQPSRVVANTERILALLERRRVQATFFVLGWVAERYPALVRAIASGGHELASHGHAHQLVYRQTPAEFADDVGRALGAVRAALGGDGAATDHLLGYRAPAFSVTNASLWALDVLRRHGFRYDSSILPVDVPAGSVGAAARGGKQLGVDGASRFAAQVAGGLWEFPVATVRVAGRTVPVAGGGYFRLFPLWATDRALRRINAEGAPAVVYLHPWEFDPEPPHVPGTPRLAHFRHSINLTKTAARLERLLERFAFASMRQVFARELAPI